VEAAGVEPVPAEIVNWPMARDFSSEVLCNSLPCGQLVVLWSALESSGVLPSLGDIMEMASQAFSQPFPARTTIAAAALPLGVCVEIDLVVKAWGGAWRSIS
jgi:enamine deaminase RidA (YjgF/YER057c/UK114 family)